MHGNTHRHYIQVEKTEFTLSDMFDAIITSLLVLEAPQAKFLTI